MLKTELGERINNTTSELLTIMRRSTFKKTTQKIKSTNI